MTQFPEGFDSRVRFRPRSSWSGRRSPRI